MRDAMREIWESAQIGRKVGAVALVIVLMTGAFFVGNLGGHAHARLHPAGRRSSRRGVRQCIQP